MHKTTLVCALLAAGPLLHGCAPGALKEAPSQGDRVWVCNGTGAYASCKRLTSAEYAKTLRDLKVPLTGSRIRR